VKSGASKRAPGRRAVLVGGPSLDGEAGLERIKHLEELLARARVKNRRQPELIRAIQIEANAYRKILDREQAAATRDSRPEFGLDPVSVSKTVRQTTDHIAAAGSVNGARNDRARGTKGRPRPIRAKPR
jgi:hypothetical protein